MIRVLHTPGHRPEHCCFEVDRRLARRRAVARDHRRLAPDRRCRSARPRLGGVEGATRPVRKPAAAARARRRRRGLSRPRRGLSLWCRDELEGLLDDRLRAARSTGRWASDQDEFVQDRANSSRHAPEHGPHRRAEPRARSSQPSRRSEPSTRQTAQQFSTSGRRASSSPGTCPARSTCPFSGSSFATKSALRAHLRRARRDPRVLDRGRRGAAQGFARSASSSSAGTSPSRRERDARARSRSRSSTSLLAEGEVEVLDVREKSERDEGYIDGTRHIPYRLVRACVDDLRSERPVITICTSGSRAVIAASVLAANGIDAHPVLGGGVEDWAERGGKTVHFRRCGNSRPIRPATLRPREHKESRPRIARTPMRASTRRLASARRPSETKASAARRRARPRLAASRSLRRSPQLRGSHPMR